MSENQSTAYDAVVIGAGAGGMAAAAYLNKYGYRTLLVESRPQVGGRASTVDIDGFGINTGAQIFELGGENKRLFDAIGVPIRARRAVKPLVLRFPAWDLQMMSGFSGQLLNKIVIPIVGGLARSFGWFRPRPGITLDRWLLDRGASDKLRRLLRNLTAALMAAEPRDVEAALFFDYMTKKGGITPYGAHPHGSIGPWKDVAAHFVGAGGTLWLDSTVKRIGVGADGLADSVTIQREGREVRVPARLVVSDVGPVATLGLAGDSAFPPGYAESIRQANYPGTLITLNFATKSQIPRLDTLVFFAYTERLAYANAVTAMSPALAPPGWHLYAASSTPHPASSGFDFDKEVEILKRETAEYFPQFSEARLISIENCTGDWPGQRAIPGRDWPNTTPIANLWNVGDGARPWMGAGQSGCVHSARLVVEQILEAFPLSSRPAN